MIDTCGLFVGCLLTCSSDEETLTVDLIATETGTHTIEYYFLENVIRFEIEGTLGVPFEIPGQYFNEYGNARIKIVNPDGTYYTTTVDGVIYETFYLVVKQTVDANFIPSSGGGSSTVNHDTTLVGDGSLATPLGVNTSVIATQVYADSAALAAADDWGSDVVNHDATLTGDGTVGNPLAVDTTVIATQAYADAAAAAVAHNPVTLDAGATTQQAANLVGQVLELVQATGATDGVMSAADKTKLDSDVIQDAADVLAAAPPVTLNADQATQESANLAGQEIQLVAATGSTYGVMSPTDKTNLDALQASIANVKKTSIGFTAFVSSGSLATGKVKGFFTCPYAGTITGWNIVLDAGTATIKVWKIATGTAKPTIADVINTVGVAISSGTAVHSAVVTDFTTVAVTANDIFAFDITATSGVTELTFNLELTKT